jgi:hypothetical protein
VQKRLGFRKRDCGQDKMTLLPHRYMNTGQVTTL